MQPSFVENTIQINAPVSAVWNVLVNPEETKNICLATRRF